MMASALAAMAANPSSAGPSVQQSQPPATSAAMPVWPRQKQGQHSSVWPLQDFGPQTLNPTACSLHTAEGWHAVSSGISILLSM